MSGYLTVGLLAHVDAGKTTLSEAMLFTGGSIRRMGRVDHQSTFLDTHGLERKRGVTIFSKQAVLELEGITITLLDTPGHVDFSSETQRVLQVLDYAILIISGTDGVQSRTTALWQLLEQYNIPVFIFINKMDLPHTNPGEILAQLKSRLHESCISFSGNPGKNRDEEIALCGETALSYFLEHGRQSDSIIADLIRRRLLFPCFFGSALKLDGVDELLRAAGRWAIIPDYPQQFGAKVFKITRDKQNNRLTHMKITGGRLCVKDLIASEKVNQIRIYSGERFTAADEVSAGMICAVTGPGSTYSGQGLGAEKDSPKPAGQTAAEYRLLPPGDRSPRAILPQLRLLGEEDPQLDITWNEQFGEIRIQLMGEVQLEVLTHMIKERLGLDVSFDAPSCEQYDDEDAIEPQAAIDEEEIQVKKEIVKGQGGFSALDKELQTIYERTYGEVKRRDILPKPPRKEIETAWKPKAPASYDPPDYLLVDGYNIIHAWEDLSRIAQQNMDAARHALTQVLSNHRGLRDREIILVFDAYKIPGGAGSVTRQQNISVVYTKEAETADAYIEKVTFRMGKKHRITVATSDGLIQLIILGHGAVRISPETLWAEIEQANGRAAEILERVNRKGFAPTIQLPDDLKGDETNG
ncbi:MAG: NYN domain-containing protein [Oscillospiraceae bacterium]|nr:NYN domain-containing protein [Oscillospiraceae bacterium]